MLWFCLRNSDDAVVGHMPLADPAERSNYGDANCYVYPDSPTGLVMDLPADLYEPAPDCSPRYKLNTTTDQLELLP